jgi:hypothetical protein
MACFRQAITKQNLINYKKENKMPKNEKEIKNMSSTELLDYTEDLRKERFVHYCRINMTVDEKFESFEELEKSAYILAIERATTAEELEKCAVSIEEYFCNGDDDPDEWATEIRIEAYGIEQYLVKELNAPAFKEFVRFTNETEIKNPLEELEKVIDN